MSQLSMIVRTPVHLTVRTLSRTFVRKATSSGSPSPRRNARRAFALSEVRRAERIEAVAGDERLEHVVAAVARLREVAPGKEAGRVHRPRADRRVRPDDQPFLLRLGDRAEAGAAEAGGFVRGRQEVARRDGVGLGTAARTRPDRAGRVSRRRCRAPHWSQARSPICASSAARWKLISLAVPTVARRPRGRAGVTNTVGPSPSSDPTGASGPSLTDWRSYRDRHSSSRRDASAWITSTSERRFPRAGDADEAP